MADLELRVLEGEHCHAAGRKAKVLLELHAYGTHRHFDFSLYLDGFRVGHYHSRDTHGFEAYQGLCRRVAQKFLPKLAGVRELLVCGSEFEEHHVGGEELALAYWTLSQAMRR
jgi:hypothetical protein